MKWFYDEEMEECACGYAEYVLSLVGEAKKTCRDPVVLIEQRLDFSRYVEEGFGTGDCVIIADGTLYIIDYKHGKGVEVSAEGNPQMMLYALGLFDGIYDIESVRMALYQPRRENVSVYAMAKADLLQWAVGELSEKAKLAYAGEGDFCAGEHCKFCKAKAVCRKRAEYNLELGRFIGQYRTSYFRPDKQNGQVVFSYKPLPGAEKQIYSRISDITISMKSTDHLQMPELINSRYTVYLSETEREKYEELKKDLVLQLPGGEITAANAASLSGKLSQMANGAVYTDAGDVIAIHERKLDALEDIIEAANGKSVLVVYWFRYDLERITERLKN